MIDGDWAPLLAAAKVAMANAYTPYSHFDVGAAILDERGVLHSGCNVENAAYPEGTCAEAGAIAAMALMGGRKIKAILVVGRGDELVTPCGGCRQKIREFAQPDTPIAIASPGQVRTVYRLDELLPVAFGPNNLETE